MVEVMVVVAIVGVVATIAYPNYQEYLQRGRRAEARTGLLQAAQWLERVATATGRYPEEADFPSSLQAVPSGTYAIAYVADLAGTAYMLAAVPLGPQRKDRCGSLTLTQHGLKGISEPVQQVDSCWSR